MWNFHYYQTGVNKFDYMIIFKKQKAVLDVRSFCNEQESIMCISYIGTV